MLHKLFHKKKEPVQPHIFINITSDEPAKPTGRYAYNVVDASADQMWAAKSHVANQLDSAKDYYCHISRP